MVPLEEPGATGDALGNRPEAYVRAMSEHTNALARAGWEYVRTDTLTTSRKSFWRKIEETTSVLVFRRPFRVEPMPGMDVAAAGVVTPRRVERPQFSGPRLAYSANQTVN